MKSILNRTPEFIFPIVQLLFGAFTIWVTYDLEGAWGYLLGGVGFFIWGIINMVKYFKHRKEKILEE